MPKQIIIVRHSIEYVLEVEAPTKEAAIAAVKETNGFGVLPKYYQKTRLKAGTTRDYYATVIRPKAVSEVTAL